MPSLSSWSSGLGYGGPVGVRLVLVVTSQICENTDSKGVTGILMVPMFAGIEQ
jgi:hypothetical protein